MADWQLKRKCSQGHTYTGPVCHECIGDEFDQAVDEKVEQITGDDALNRTAVCGICGNEFSFQRKRGRPYKYCSPECSREAQATQVEEYRKERNHSEVDEDAPEPDWVTAIRDSLRDDSQTDEPTSTLTPSP